MASDIERQENAPAASNRSNTEGRHGLSHVQVMAALIVLTVVEVLITYTPLPRLLFLLPLAAVQVGLVLVYHMQLRRDNPVFGIVFFMGLLMGFILIAALALMFGPPLFGRTQ